MFISDQGCLLRKEASGESHILLIFFLLEHGLTYVLARRPAKSPASHHIPDLFASGTVIVEQKDPSRPAFLKDFSPGALHTGIGQSYRHLKAASSLACFFERNLLHMEHYPEAWDLLHTSLAALAARPLPEATLLKACFLLARAEGYPVIAHWLAGKPQSEQQALSAILRNPLGKITATADELNAWMHNLSLFLKRETDLLPPGDLD